uniref:Integrase, catalytic region, zinc finger, CCHC-type, peptidase aspartic, catalytic n=1 Tax=Tanacetum cinerariifolium TaxID=118510 RepID=A0A699HA53_TANCI|nr:integrase, catalytic region, zinc finger, CCHC-type, peptidase aspartic, catalytic [Tanacetum cinerariifolium]
MTTPNWRSRFIRYIDTRPNGKALRKCILSGPYKPTTILVQAIEATDDSLAILEHTTVETLMNISPENKAHFLAEKEAIHLILTGIRDEIYSTVDACQTAQEMFVMIVKQKHKLDEVSYHKLFNILKQYQNEVNELRVERLARNANPLALVATAQANKNPYYQTSRSHKSYAPSSKPLIPTRSHITTRHKGKEIAKPITPASKTASEKDSDPEQARRDKDMQKNLALIAKKPKRVNDSAYHKEKMLLCKQAEQGVPLQTEQYDWLADTDEEVDEHELEAHYSYMAKIQEVPTADSGTISEPVEQVQNDVGYNVFANELQHYEQSEAVSNTCLVETDDSNVIPDSPDMCEDDIQNDQNDVESDDERVALANLIVNLKLDVDENKKIQKQLKKANTTLAQKLKECKAIFVETSKSLGESISVRDGCLHMTGNLKLLCNFVKKFLGTNRFGNDQFTPILGYGDLVQGNVTINRVYYVEGLNHNIFSVGQFCDAALKVALRKSTCFVRDLQGNELLTGSNPQGKQPSTNIQPTSEPLTPTYVHAEENNNDQAEEGEQLQDDEFTNPFYTPEAMADSAWIEAMQEELHQFDRLQVWKLVDKSTGKTVIKLKWLWKNKKDKDQTVIHNKA